MGFISRDGRMVGLHGMVLSEIFTFLMPIGWYWLFNNNQFAMIDRTITKSALIDMQGLFISYLSFALFRGVFGCIFCKSETWIFTGQISILILTTKA